MSAAPGTTVEEQLGWEARWRSRAGAAAIVAGVLTLGGAILGSQFIGLRDFPQVSFVDAMRNALRGGSDVGLREAQVLLYDDRAALLISGAVLQGIGALGITWALGYLYRAARARRPRTPGAALPLVIGGAVALAVGQVVIQAAAAIKAHEFAQSTDHSHDATKAVFESDYLLAGQAIRQFAVFALGFGFILIALNAMRAGLLTRFMGVLGIIVGVLFVIPLGSPLPVIQTFWLIALGVLILGRWPNGVPPAWETGEAHPWPTQQELREARDRAQPRDDESANLADDGDERGDEAASGSGHPSSKKKKRKRRS